MIRIGIIAGGGELPLLVGKNLIKKNFSVTFFVIKEFFNENFYSNYQTVKIHLNSLKEILNHFNKHKIEKIIMLGKVNRPSLKDIKFDIDTFKFIKNNFLENKGDNNLLVFLQDYFSKKGFPIFDWIFYCEDLFANKKNLTEKIPSKKAILNKDKGLKSFKIFGQSDIGQSMIIQNERILGLESVEGTNELINRCFSYKKKGDKGILIKLSKYNQSRILDIPAIGVETMKLLNEFDYEGVFLELNRCLIINKIEVIKYADLNNLFIAAINKID